MQKDDAVANITKQNQSSQENSCTSKDNETNQQLIGANVLPLSESNDNVQEFWSRNSRVLQQWYSSTDKSFIFLEIRREYDTLAAWEENKDNLQELTLCNVCLAQWELNTDDIGNKLLAKMFARKITNPDAFFSELLLKYLNDVLGVTSVDELENIINEYKFVAEELLDRTDVRVDNMTIELFTELLAFTGTNSLREGLKQEQDAQIRAIYDGAEPFDSFVGNLHQLMVQYHPHIATRNPFQLQRLIRRAGCVDLNEYRNFLRVRAMGFETIPEYDAFVQKYKKYIRIDLSKTDQAVDIITHTNRNLDSALQQAVLEGPYTQLYVFQRIQGQILQGMGIIDSVQKLGLEDKLKVLRLLETFT